MRGRGPLRVTPPRFKIIELETKKTLEVNFVEGDNQTFTKYTSGGSMEINVPSTKIKTMHEY